MPTLAEYEADYRAPDRDFVLANIRQYGTDDRSKWGAPPPANTAAPAPPPTAPNPATTWNTYNTPSNSNTGVTGGGNPPSTFLPTGPPASTGPTGSRADFQREWMASGNDVNLQNEILRRYNVTLDQAGRGRIPGGDLLDLRIGAKAGINRAGWTPVVDPLNPGAYPGGGRPAAPGGTAPGGPGGAPGGIQGQLYDMLMQRAKQGLAIGRNDPIIRAQADAYAANEERARRTFLDEMAEGTSPYSTGQMQGQQRMSAERLGQRVGGFEAQLMGRELEARRAEIQHALDSLGNRLTEDQRIALQRELGIMDDLTRRYGIESQRGIAEGELGLGRQRLGYDIGRSEMDYWLRSQGL